MADGVDGVSGVASVTGTGGGTGDAFQRTVDFLQQGGPVVLLLVGMSIVAVTVVLAKLWQFRIQRVGRLQTAEEALRLYHAGRSHEALAAAERSSNPVAQVLALAIGGQLRGVPEVNLREELLRYGSDLLEGLKSWLRVLEVIGTLAPLLGLFGTVLGMIEAFRQMEAAGAHVNPAVLSGGIWEALLTTAVGLAVAIPVVAVLNWLERRIDRLAHQMDSLVTRVFTLPHFAIDREDEGNAVAFAARAAAAPGE